MLGLDKKSRLNRHLRKAAAEGDATAIGRLLSEGADIESRGFSRWGGTALHFAATRGKTGAIAALLDHGADIGAKDRFGETPLFNALLFEHSEAAELLLDRGAETALAGKQGRTPLSLAARSGFKDIVNRINGAPETPEKKDAPRRAENPDEVVFFRPHGNRLLEETFNFASRERITLLRNGMDGPVEAMTRDSFDAIGDKAALRHAFELYAAKGGKLKESGIFPPTLSKPKTTPGGPP